MPNSFRGPEVRRAAAPIVLLLLVIPEVDVVNFGDRQFGETG